MAKGRFEEEAERAVVDLTRLFNRSIRAALVVGLVTAVRATKHDSSNAAAHWMVAADNGSKSRPWSRKTGKINDFRGTKGSATTDARAPVAPVGYRRDGGKHAAATVRFVRERELAEVINRLVQGRHPEGKFYFYHPLAAGAESEAVDDVGLYAERAHVEEAGNSAVEATAQAFHRNLMAGNVRKSK